MKSITSSRLGILFNLKSMAGILLSALCVWWAFKDFKFNSFIKIIIEIKYVYVILAALFLWLSVWLRGLRWKFLFSSSQSSNIFSLYKIQMMGYFGNNVLPLRAGEIMRAFMINKELGLSKTYAFGTIILERVLDMVTLIALTFILVVIYPDKNILQSNLAWGGFIVILVVLILFKILNHLKEIKTDIFFVKHIRGIIDGVRSLESKSIFPVIILSILIWGIYLLDVYLLQCAFELNLNFSQILMMLVFSSIVIGVPAAPGMVGTYHASVQYVLVNLFGFSSILGNAFSLVMHAYGYILLTVIGSYYFMKSQFELGMISRELKEK
jgi:uncharacterized protein (TIRG00374 family)